MSRTQIIVITVAAVLLAAGLVVTIRGAVAAPSTAYSWVAFGDLRPSSGATDSAYSSGFTHVRDKLIATPHAFDVIPGDLVQGLSGTDSAANDLAKYDWLFQNMGAEQSVPKVYAPGNHENFASANYRAAWAAKIDAAHYRTYSYGAGTAASPRTLVIQLSTEEPGYSGKIGYVSETSTSNSPQAKWLVSTLQREAFNANEYLVTVFHRPVADPKPGESSGERVALEDLFTRYGMDLVINAHAHVYVRHMMPNGTPYLLVGNGGAPLYAVGSWSHTTPGTDVKTVVGSYGFVKFDVQSDGTVKATAYAVDPSGWAWTTPDTFTVPQTRPTATTTPTPAPTGTSTPTSATRLTLRLSGLKAGTMRLGKSMTAKGAVTPTSLAGTRVTLTVQKRTRAGWVKSRRTARTIGGAATYSWKYKPAKRGTYRVRATIAETATHAGAKAVWRVFRVR